MIQPLSKKIYEEAKKRGIKIIRLEFQGGSDEGHLFIELNPYNENNLNFEEEIEDWVWEVYNYSGAGDGSDYGDNITYNLVDNTVSHEEWYMEPTYNDYGKQKLEFEENEETGK